MLIHVNHLPSSLPHFSAAGEKGTVKVLRDLIGQSSVSNERWHTRKIPGMPDYKSIKVLLSFPLE